VFADRTGTGPDAENGRCRAFGLAPAPAGVTGTGTDNRIARWDGTSAIQDSSVVIEDGGSLKVGDPTVTPGFFSALSLVPASASGLAHPYLFLSLPDPPGDALVARFYLSDSYVGAALPADHDFVIGYSGADTLGVEITSSYAVTRGFRSGPTVHVGIDGTLAPGMDVKGGIIVSAGSGSFVGTGTANSFTNTNSFTSPGAGDVPLTIQGAAAQTANLTEWKDSGGSVLASVSAAGALTAQSLNGTYDAGTW
jgi:hypothetical protein